MSHYSDNPQMCRVDFWKKSGKWYTTEAVEFPGTGWDHNSPPIHDVFREALHEHLKDTPNRLKGMTATCLEPYHKHSHPISLIV